MFGLGFADRVEKVLDLHFRYRAIHPVVFKGICKETKARGLNEYDAAIKFMFVVMDALYVDGQEKTKAFIANQCMNIEVAVNKSSVGFEDLKPTIIELFDRHGLFQDNIAADEPSHAYVPKFYGNFDQWLKEFKKACGRYREALAPAFDGASIIDFLDHEPFKRAYRDGVHPDVVAKSFAPQFDPRNLTVGK